MAPTNLVNHPGAAATPRGRAALPWALAAVVVFVLLGLLSAQLVLLRAQLRHVASQDRVSRILLSRADPALAPLPATIHQLMPALRAVRGSDPVRSARIARGLAAQATPLLSTLRAVDLPGLFNQLRGLAAAATTRDRLAIALDAADRFFTAVRGANLIEPLARVSTLLPPALADVQGMLARVPRVLATLRGSKRTQDHSLSVQKQSLAIQRQTLALLQQSLVVQQQVLQHARNLDSKIP